MESDRIRRGREGYEAYATSTGGKTFDGRDMPAWDALPMKIREAWSAAGDKIRDLCAGGHNS